MLARSRQAWEAAAGGSRLKIGVLTYSTEASTSESGRMRPQVERAIRIKSQNQRQTSRQLQYNDEKRFSPFEPKQKQIPRPSGSKLPDLPSNSKQPYRLVEPGRRSIPFESKPTSRTFEARESSRPYKSRQRPSSIQSRFQDSDRRPNFRHEQSSVRELRFSISQKLMTLAKNGKSSPETAFLEGKELFDSISGFTKREPRLYNAMIRLAMKAGKRQYAIKIFNEMKKNGVAPTAHTYRSIFEGTLLAKTSPSEDSVVVQNVHDIFEEFETIWRGVFAVKKKKPVEDEIEMNRSEETSTARSYASSKEYMEKNLFEFPASFDMACLYYFAFLFSIKAYDKASALLKRVEDLASPGTARRKDSKLPFMLYSRYLFELLKADSDVQDGYRSTVLQSYKKVLNTLRDDRTLFQEQHYNATLIKPVVDPNTERREIDKSLYVAISILAKYDIADRHKIIEQSLQELYNNKYLASLPPITIEKTIRVAMENIKRNPNLVLNIFESALDYNDNALERSDDKFLFRDQHRVNNKDVIFCWTKAWTTAIIEQKDLTKAMDLIQRAKTMLESSKSSKELTSRLTPPIFARPFIFSQLMRLCYEKHEWNTAIQVWQLFFDDLISSQDRLTNIPSLQRLIYYFLSLACKLERENRKAGIVAIVKYSRITLVLLEKNFGLENSALWERSEKILKERNAASKLQDLEGKKDETDANFCLDYVNVIRMTCKVALDTGEQGVDLAEKDQVEKWKDVRRKAAQLYNLGQGLEVFDEAEADWLRSGAKGKTSLALTDEDMRELLS